MCQPGPVEQSIRSLTADPGVVSSIPAHFHTFMEINHELSSMVILLLLIQEGLCYKLKYEHKILVNRLVKLVQQKVWLG